MQIYISERDVVLSIFACIAGFILYAFLDYNMTPTMEEIAAIKAEQDARLEKDKMEAEMMFKAISLSGKCAPWAN